MTALRVVLATSAGAIAGLLGFGLAPSHGVVWGLGAALAAVGLVVLVNHFILRDEDRDPTIRPPNLPYDDRR